MDFSQISNPKVLKTLGLLVITAVFFAFKVERSHFICNQLKCVIENKNIYGITLSEKPVDIQNILKFESGITHKMFELNPLNGNRSKKQILYPIYAVMQNGTKVRFFDTPCSDEYRAHRKVEELNNLIKDKNNIYIDYSYKGY